MDLQATLDLFWILFGSPVALGVLGLLIGSFLNVVVYRKPIIMMREWLLDAGGLLGESEVWQTVFGKAPPAEITEAGKTIDAHLETLTPLGLSTPRSRCGACGHQIRWYENIPLLSWLALRARCSACGTPISVRYPLVELATGVLFAAASWKFGPHPAAAAWCVALALLLAMALIDLDTKYLPDDLNGPLLWIGLVVAALGWTVPLHTALWGAVAGYLPLWLVSKGYKLVRGIDGMGGGDLKLLAALGVWLGWHAVLPIILIASIVGVCVTVPAKLLARHGDGHRYPFGPFLIGGGIVVIFVGADTCLEWLNIVLPA